MSCSVTLKNIKAKIANRVLFENLNLNLSHKEKIAIIGQNGSGKSTLLEIIGGLNKPCDGSVEIFHEPMRELNEFEKYRNLIGFLFQNSDDQFIAPSVIEDVAFSLLARGISKDEARKRFILDTAIIPEGVTANDSKYVAEIEELKRQNTILKAKLAKLLSMFKKN